MNLSNTDNLELPLRYNMIAIYSGFYFYNSKEQYESETIIKDQFLTRLTSAFVSGETG